VPREANMQINGLREVLSADEDWTQFTSQHAKPD